MGQMLKTREEKPKVWKGYYRKHKSGHAIREEKPKVWKVYSVGTKVILVK